MQPGSPTPSAPPLAADDDAAGAPAPQSPISARPAQPPTGAPAPRPPKGVLARMQRAITLAVALSALCWLAFWWPHSKAVAWAGFWLFALGHAWFLAIEFIVSWKVNRVDPSRDPPKASVPAMARAWLAECVMTPRVFYWRQPFRGGAVPDSLRATPGRRGVVLVHGLVCNRGFWNPWLARLSRDNRAFVAVTLEPIFGSMDDYAPAIEHAVRQVTQATGLAPLVVCHSMGGLVARAWLRAAGAGADRRVYRIVTIGSPHHGSWIARWSQQTNGRQMRIHSKWLADLRAAEPPGLDALFICWYSNCDNMVFPAPTATLPGAVNRFVAAVPHVALAFQPEVMRETLAMLNDEKEPNHVA